jgi:hypothetical protein
VLCWARQRWAVLCRPFPEHSLVPACTCFSLVLWVLVLGPAQTLRRRVKHAAKLQQHTIVRLFETDCVGANTTGVGLRHSWLY